MNKAIFCTIAALTSAALCSSTVISFPPTNETLQGIWIGIPYQVNDFCRLELSNNAGFFAHGFEGERPMLYMINSYKTDGEGKVTFKISPASTNAYPILVTGRANSYRISIVIKSPDGGWSHESVLYREETVNKILQDLKQSLDDSKKPKK